MMGVGIGSFLEGLAKGASIRRSMDAQGLEEERLQLAREAAQRDAEKWNYEKGILDKKTQWATEDRDYELGKRSRDDAEHKQDRDYTLSEHDYMTKKRELDAPAEAAQREGIIAQTDYNKLKLDEAKKDAPVADLRRKKETLETESAIQTAERAKKEQQLFATAGEEGVKTYNETRDKAIGIEKDEKNTDVFTFDGQRYKTKEDALSAYEKRHPYFDSFLRGPGFQNVIKNRLASGDIDGAKKFMEWTKYPGVREGIETTGRLTQALAIGDIDKVNKELKTLGDNPDYLTLHGYDIEAQFQSLPDNAGRRLMVKFTDKKTKKEFMQNLDTQNEQFVFLNTILNVENAFKSGEAQQASVAEMNKKIKEKSIDVQGEIAKEKAKKAIGAPEEVLKLLSNDPKFMSATPEEKKKMYNEVMQLTQPVEAAPAPPAQPQRPPTFFGR